MIASIVEDKEGNLCIEFTDEQCKELGLTEDSIIEWEVDGTDVIMRIKE